MFLIRYLYVTIEITFNYVRECNFIKLGNQKNFKSVIKKKNKEINWDIKSVASIIYYIHLL